MEIAIAVGAQLRLASLHHTPVVGVGMGKVAEPAIACHHPCACGVTVSVIRLRCSLLHTVHREEEAEGSSEVVGIEEVSSLTV